MLVPARRLIGLSIQATDGILGEVHDLYFDDQAWTVRYFVADTGTWLPGRQVLISPAAVVGLDCDAGTLAVNLSQEQVRNSPGIDAHEPVSRQHEVEVARYYGWPTYWPSGAMETRAVRAMTSEREQERTLRSATECVNYYLHAEDGELGHVEEMLVESETWELRFLVVDTHNWWPGQLVLIDPHWVEEFDWAQSIIRVNLHRDEIRNSPEYDPSKPLDREYETNLYTHYQRPRAVESE